MIKYFSFVLMLAFAGSVVGVTTHAQEEVSAAQEAVITPSFSRTKAIRSAIMAGTAAAMTLIILQKNDVTIPLRVLTTSLVAVGVFSLMQCCVNETGGYPDGYTPSPWASPYHDDRPASTPAQSEVIDLVDGLADSCGSECLTCPPAAVFLS